MFKELPDQYRFSVPTVRRYCDAGTVGTCIGFEVARVLENHDALPGWDAMRVAGAMQFLKIAWVLGTQLPVFNAFARKMGHWSALDVVCSRDALREKYQIHAVQDPTYTLHLVNDSSLASSLNG